MKKQVSIFIAIFALNSPCIVNAAHTDLSDFFIKANYSAHIFNDAKHFGNIKAKSNLSSAVAVGFGYYVLDNFRADLSFEYYLNPTFKANTCNNHPVYGTQRLKQNLQLSTLMLNGNVDIIDFNSVKLFATAGIGVATHKTRHRITGFDSENNIIDAKEDTKTSHNIAYSVGAGISFPLSDHIHAEFGYSCNSLLV